MFPPRADILKALRMGGGDSFYALAKVEICGVNTTKLPTLTAAETDALLHRAKDGDAAAREKLVEGNLRLVLSVIQRFSGRGENADDLFQVGCVGLLKAIDNFDTSQNVRFSTYGVPMIIGEIRRFLRDNNALRVSRSLRDTAYRAMQSREELEKQLGREPTVDEIARKTGLSRREVSAALESVVEPLSLEEPVYADGGDAVYVIDQVRDPDGEDSWISGLQFRQTVAGLTPREKRIMELRYLKGKTQMEVAREIGISQAQVSRLEKAALEQFRGEIMQLPPMYSAIKVNGQKLYDLARQGREVARKPRMITIFDLALTQNLGNGQYALRIVCSKGTYIRTLCHDLGQVLGCGGCMAALRRTEASNFRIDEAVTLEDVQREGEALLRPTDSLFRQYPAYTIPSTEQERKCLCGNSLRAKLPDGLYRVYGRDGAFLALSEAKDGTLTSKRNFFSV